jgi:DNA helicase II / ATP-dependent DNA helicase PcrA
MSDLLNELNPQQQLAVAAPPGPVLVLAGPGSGKTRVLTFRIAYLIAALDVPAYQIMAVTFTNKAAREMGHRVESLLGEKTNGLWLGTFHAICGRILRREAAHLPVDQNFVIYDADDQLALIKRVIKERRCNESDYRPNQVLARISNAKNDLLGPDEYPLVSYRDETIKALYQAYQAYLVASNAMDFDDMLLYTANLLETQPELRQKYAHRFQHILVDEFQDTNLAQYQLIHHLASLHHNIFVVGDEDQSIYRWRGADYRNVQRFSKDYPKGEKILLTQNYRSTQTILDTAVAVINENPHRTEKSLFTNRGTGEAVTIYEAPDDHDEAAYVVDTIARQVMQGKAKESDFAIMYRTNAQSRLLEEAFRRANMSYRLVGAQRFYGRREVKDMIAFLRLIYNPKDEVSLNRVINLPPRGIGQVTLEKLQTYAQQAGLSSGEVLLILNTDSGSHDDIDLGSAAIRLHPFSKLLTDWQENLDQISLTTLFDQVLLDTGYESYIKADSDELQDRWGNVLELRGVLLEYEEQGLGEFLEAMALVADQDTLPDTIDAPTLLTLHAAKGLEFPQVFIIGLDEYFLPHSRSRDDPDALAEERRLFYVGLTRAQDQLFLVRAQRRRSPYGSYEYMQPSRFLSDIPDELTQGNFSRFVNHRDNYDINQYQWDRQYTPTPKRTVTKTTETREQRFHPEMHVQHPVYGEGVVRNSRLEYGDETVEVYFEGLGLKALVASMSSLEILGD